jgi:hypothetical protein
MLFQALKQVHLTGIEEFKEDFISVEQQDSSLSTLIAEKLEEIFLEDARFYDMLLLYLTASANYVKVVKPYLQKISPLKRLHQEHLEKAFS